MIHVVFYSKYGDASMKLYNLVKEFSEIDAIKNIRFIEADSMKIRKQLKYNKITELPLLYVMSDNGDIDMYTGKKCFMYIDDYLNTLIKIVKEKYEQPQHIPQPPVMPPHIHRRGAEGFSTDTGSKIGRSIDPQSYVSHKNDQIYHQDSNFFNKPVPPQQSIETRVGNPHSPGQDTYQPPPPISDIDKSETERTIMIESQDQPQKPPSQQQQQPPVAKKFDNDPALYVQPEYPSSKSPSTDPPKLSKLFAPTDEDDPSGMGLKGAGGNASSIARMLEVTRDSMPKIQS